MASTRHAGDRTPSKAFSVAQAPRGSVRACVPYLGEVARHRIITADGHDMVVATFARDAGRAPFVTAAYPVQYGYLVLIRQPLCELRGSDRASALVNHDRLVVVLAEAGVGVVRARRTLAARRRAEHLEADDFLAAEAILGEVPAGVAVRG